MIVYHKMQLIVCKKTVDWE